MSADAAETLVGLGYTNVRDLGAAWRPGRTPATGSKVAETASLLGNVLLLRSRREGSGGIGPQLGSANRPMDSSAEVRTTQEQEAVERSRKGGCSWRPSQRHPSPL